jgi:uncharacterized protein YajQ (UPF0234 family)
MNLQAHLLNLSIKLAPEDAKAIAQLASVAQGIVQTSVKLEAIKVERQDKDDNLRDILERLRNFQP